MACPGPCRSHPVPSLQRSSSRAQPTGMPGAFVLHQTLSHPTDPLSKSIAMRRHDNTHPSDTLPCVGVHPFDCCSRTNSGAGIRLTATAFHPCPLLQMPPFLRGKRHPVTTNWTRNRWQRLLCHHASPLITLCCTLRKRWIGEVEIDVEIVCKRVFELRVFSVFL